MHQRSHSRASSVTAFRARVESVARVSRLNAPFAPSLARDPTRRVPDRRRRRAFVPRARRGSTAIAPFRRVASRRVARVARVSTHVVVARRILGDRRRRRARAFSRARRLARVRVGRVFARSSFHRPAGAPRVDASTCDARRGARDATRAVRGRRRRAARTNASRARRLQG